MHYGGESVKSYVEATHEKAICPVCICEAPVCVCLVLSPLSWKHGVLVCKTCLDPPLFLARPNVKLKCKGSYLQAYNYPHKSYNYPHKSITHISLIITHISQGGNNLVRGTVSCIHHVNCIHQGCVKRRICILTRVLPY